MVELSEVPSIPWILMQPGLAIASLGWYRIFTVLVVLRRAQPSCRIEMQDLFYRLNCFPRHDLIVPSGQNVFEKFKVKIYLSKVGEISKKSDFRACEADLEKPCFWCQKPNFRNFINFEEIIFYFKLSKTFCPLGTIKPCLGKQFKR